jgi:hypothetical protein
VTGEDDRPRFLVELGDELARVAHQDQARRRSLGRVRLRPAVLAGAATLAMGAAAGAASGVIDLPGGESGFVPRTATARFAPSLVEHVSVLGRARTGADSMGDAAARVVGADGPAPASSLRVHPPAPPAHAHARPTELTVWLLPTVSGAVNIQVLAPGAEGPMRGFTADAQLIGSGRARINVEHDVLGIVPDGVSAVTIVLRGGERVQLPVADNVYGAHLGAPAVDVELAP